MNMVDSETAAAIREAYFESGELAAAVELRRPFAGIADNEQARSCARAIAGWQPRPLPEPTRRRSRPAEKLKARTA